MDEPFPSEIVAREKRYPAERLLETILLYAAEKIQALTFSFRSILSLLAKKKKKIFKILMHSTHSA